MKKRNPQTKPIDSVIPRNTTNKNGMSGLRTSSEEGGENESDFLSDVQKKPAKSRKPVKIFKVIKKTLLILVLLAILATAYLGVKFLWTAKNVFNDSGEGAVALSGKELQPGQLGIEGDSRVNILVIGIGGDGHDGGDLSDTNLLVTLDPREKTAGMLSIPRDTWVNVPGFYNARINNAHAIGEQQGYEGGGPALLAETIEYNFNIPVHYYVRADLEGFKSAIDAVGGIEYYVEEELVDYIYTDEELGYPGPFKVEQGLQQFDGQRALLYARSRSTSARGDFDRNDRQRDILVALMKEALSVGTFSNPTKVSSLLSSASSNVRTNVAFGDIKTFYDLVGSIDSSQIQSLGLSTDEGSYLQNANIGGASVLVPSAGEGDYSEITDYFYDNFPDTYLVSESPTVAVFNSTEAPGYASSTAKTLGALGYDVAEVGNLDMQLSGSKVYKNNTQVDKPYTENYLSKRFDAQVDNKSQIPAGVNSTADYIIVLGN